jgi:hypothetical protein
MLGIHCTRSRKDKVDFPRAYKAHFVGYESSRTLEPTFKVIQVHPNGTYGKVRISKDVTFDDTIDFHNETVSPTDTDFNRGIDEQERIVPVVPAPTPVWRTVGLGRKGSPNGR